MTGNSINFFLKLTDNSINQVCTILFIMKRVKKKLNYNFKI